MKSKKKIIIILVSIILIISLIIFLITVVFKDEKDYSKASKKSDEIKKQLDKEYKESLQNQQSFVTKNERTVFFNIYETLKETEESNGTTRILKKKDPNEQGKNGIYGFGVEISLIDKSIDEYMSSKDETRAMLERTSNHTDIELSETKSKVINGKKIYYRGLDYKINGEPCNDLYITFFIEDNLTYLIECRRYDVLTNEELKSLLNIDVSSDIKLSENSNYITIGNNKKIIFEVANSLQDDSYGDFRYFRKKDTLENSNRIEVLYDNMTLNEYMNSLEDSSNYRVASVYRNNSNVELSKINKKTVNGKKFSYRIIKYDDKNGNECQNMYIAYQYEEGSLYKYLYIVEIEHYEVFKDDEINGFLNITIEE